jgi:hypothetical protein
MFGACAWRIHSYAAIGIWHVQRAAALEAHPFSAAHAPAGEKGQAIERNLDTITQLPLPGSGVRLSLRFLDRTPDRSRANPILLGASRTIVVTAMLRKRWGEISWPKAAWVRRHTRS